MYLAALAMPTSCCSHDVPLNADVSVATYPQILWPMTPITKKSQLFNYPGMLGWGRPCLNSKKNKFGCPWKSIDIHHEHPYMFVAIHRHAWVSMANFRITCEPLHIFAVALNFLRDCFGGITRTPLWHHFGVTFASGSLWGRLKSILGRFEIQRRDEPD